jgi:hypothetical protein
MADNVHDLAAFRERRRKRLAQTREASLTDAELREIREMTDAELDAEIRELADAAGVTVEELLAEDEAAVKAEALAAGWTGNPWYWDAWLRGKPPESWPR